MCIFLGLFRFKSIIKDSIGFIIVDTNTAIGWNFHYTITELGITINNGTTKYIIKENALVLVIMSGSKSLYS